MPSRERVFSGIYFFIAESLLFAVCLGSIYLAVSDVILWSRAKSWVEIPVTILEASSKYHRRILYNSHEYYELHAEYAYDYQGKKYHGSNIFFTPTTSHNHGFNDFKLMQSIKSKQKKKLPLSAFVDPEHPEESVISRDFRWYRFFNLLLYGVFAPGAWALSILSNSRQSRFDPVLKTRTKRGWRYHYPQP